jgi:hypothetical protein
MRILALLFCSARLASAQCPTYGGTGTTDGGAVTYHCRPKHINQPCENSAFGSYGVKPSDLPGQPEPCMSYYYNTADGPHNTNTTIIMMRGGGNSFVGSMSDPGNVDWDNGAATSNNGQPVLAYALVDGTAVPGKHFNFVSIQFSMFAGAFLHGDISPGDTSFRIDGSNACTHFWPQAAPYRISVESERMEVSAQTGTYGTCRESGYTVTVPAGVKRKHPANSPVWGIDSKGMGDGATAGLNTMCSMAAALSYLSKNAGGSLPGNRHFILIANSAASYTASMVQMVGKSILSQGLCGVPDPDVSWTIDGAFYWGAIIDYGPYFILSYMLAHQVSPCTSSTVSSNGAGISLGPISADLGGIANAASLDVKNFHLAGLTAVSPTPIFTYGRNVSAQGCLIGGFNSGCLWKPNPDGFLGKIWLEIGGNDQSAGCAAALNFASTTPGAGYRVIAGGGHDGGMYTGRGCSGNPGTRAGLCYNGQSVQDLIAFIASLGNNTTNRSGRSGE